MSCDCDSWDNMQGRGFPIQSCIWLFLQGDNFLCWCFLALLRAQLCPSPSPCATLHPSVPKGTEPITLLSKEPSSCCGIAAGQSTEQQSEHCKPLHCCGAALTAPLPSEHPELGLELSWGLHTLLKGQKGVTALSCVTGTASFWAKPSFSWIWLKIQVMDCKEARPPESPALAGKLEHSGWGSRWGCALKPPSWIYLAQGLQQEVPL